MLYDNEGYDRVVNKRFLFDSIVFGSRSIVSGFIKKIQWLMQQHYMVVNRNYEKLSREIALHADAVAAAAAGSDNLKTSLQKMVPGDLCYAKLLEFYDNWINECIKTDNIYPQHRELMIRFAKDNGLEWVKDEMVIGSIEGFNTTPRRVSIKDQWTSHPNLTERIELVMEMDVVKSVDHSSAWGLFGTPIVLQKEMTSRVYERIEFDNEPTAIDTETFCERIDAYFATQKFDARYKGYFDAHDLFEFDAEAECRNVVAADDEMRLSDLDKMLNKEIVGHTKKVKGLLADLLLLLNIKGKKYGVKTFDFDGYKMNADAAMDMRVQLIEALGTTTDTLMETDKTLFRFFYSKALEKGIHQSLISDYKGYIETIKQNLTDTHLIEGMFDAIKPFYAEKVTIKQAMALGEEVKRKEGEVKERLASLIRTPAYKNFIKPGMRPVFQSFFDENRPYFEDGFIHEEVLTLLINALNAFQEVVVNHKYEIKSSFLNSQLALFED
jgi:hypothetical protein